MSKRTAVPKLSDVRVLSLTHVVAREGEFFVYLLHHPKDRYRETRSLCTLGNAYYVSWYKFSRTSTFIVEYMSQ